MSKFVASVLLLLQTVISVRPGFVDLVDGKSNVQKYEHVPAGKPIQTGPQNRIEIGLGTDSVLRLDENSTMVLESVDPADVSVRIDDGTGLLEVQKIDKPNRIRVTVGSIRALIDSKGIFRFSKAGVSVIDGKLKIENSGLTLQKGWQVTDTGGDYRESKVVLTVPPPFKSFLNSPKAGFVNAIQGEANVRPSEVAREDQPIKTGPSSYLEVLLSPGAFLRIDENSEVKIDSAGLSDVVIQVVSGSALIEDVAMDPRLAIRVIVGGAKLLIAGSGLYRFTNDTASVIDGLLRLGSKDESAAAGTLVRVTDRQYVTEDLSVEPERTGLDLWSAQRSALLARANFMADYAEWEANFFYFTNPVPHLAAWIYSPPLKGFTFIPRLNRESFYGNSFVPLYVLMPSVPFGPSSRVPTPQPPAAPNARPATVPPPKPTPEPPVPPARTPPAEGK